MKEDAGEVVKEEDKPADDLDINLPSFGDTAISPTACHNWGKGLSVW